MSLIEKIKRDQLEARKNRESTKATLLTTLIGEAEMIGKNAGNRESTDSEVIAVIKKFVKNIDEVLKVAPSDVQSVVEKGILNEYLPRQMSMEEIRELITMTFDVSLMDKGAVMQFLKKHYSGLYDGKAAVQAFDSLKVSNP